MPSFSKIGLLRRHSKEYMFSILFSVCVHIMVFVYSGQRTQYILQFSPPTVWESKSDHQPWQQVPFKTQ